MVHLFLIPLCLSQAKPRAHSFLMVFSISSPPIASGFGGDWERMGMGDEPPVIQSPKGTVMAIY